MGDCYSIFYYSPDSNMFSDSDIIGYTIDFINKKCILDPNESISTFILLESYDSYIKDLLSPESFDELINNTTIYQRLSNIINCISEEKNVYYTTPGCAIISGITLKS